MKKKKYLALLGALALMTACNPAANSSSSFEPWVPPVCDESFNYASLANRARKDTYTTYTTYLPSTLNYTKTMQSENAQHIANFIDGLVEHDRFGNLVPCLATDTGTPSDNFKTWTFTIDASKNAQWVKQDGTPYTSATRRSALVMAKDFKDNLKIVLNSTTASESAYLPVLIIEGAEQYNVVTYEWNSVNQSIPGESDLVKWDKVRRNLLYTKDSLGNDLLPTGCTAEDIRDILNFEHVGVDVDNVSNTITYHLTNSADYFPTMLTYLPFLPICYEYYEEKGGAGDEAFGSKNNILFNGAYLLDERTSNKISYRKNPLYWDVDSVKTEKVEYLKLPEQLGYDYARVQYEMGNIDAFGVNSFDVDGWNKYVVGSDGAGTILDPHNELTYSQESTGVDSTFFFYLNLNRNTETNTLSPLTTNQIANANKAFKYSYVRDAIFSALDLEAYNARNGVELLEQQQQQLNTYIPKNFISDDSGKDYFEYLLDAYQEKHTGTSREDAEKALGPGQVHQISLEDSVAKTASALAKLKEDDPSVTYPIVVEYTTFYGDVELRYYDDLFIEYTNRRLNGCITNTQYPDENNLKVCGDGEAKILIKANEKIQTSQNYITVSNTGDYSLFISGWGPDYGDPMTYAHTMVKGGDMAKHLGIGLKDELSNETNELLETYGEMVQKANNIVSSTPEQKSLRYKSFAEAEIYLLEETQLMKPLYQPGQGYSCTVSKFIPYRSPRSGYGLSGDKLKGMEILTEPLTSCERQRLRTEWINERQASI